MGQFVAGVFIAVIGAAALVGSGIANENYKRHCDRRSTASAIAGEIAAIIHMIQTRRHLAAFRAIQNQIRASGQVVRIPNIVGRGLDARLDPVIERHLDRLGLLTENRIPERISTFYTTLRGIRIDLLNLARGTFNAQQMDNLIGQDIELWTANEADGLRLCDELRAIGAEPWSLERWRFWHWLTNPRGNTT